MKRLIVFMAATALATGALASIGDKLTALGWQHLTFDEKTANDYSLNDDGHILVKGDSSVSVLWRALEPVSSDDMSLSWRWKVDKTTPVTDLSQKGGDDRPLSLYVSFKFDPERSSFWERSKRALVQPFVEDELPGRVLLYVWGGSEAGDTWIDSPYFSGIGKMKILRAANADQAAWFDQEVDLAADHLAAFGEEPAQPYQLAISSDGDDTSSTIIAEIANIIFAGQPLR